MPASAPCDDLIRMTGLAATELRVEPDATGESIGVLSGYAAVFDTDTVIDSWEGRFVERIARGAFRKTLADDGARVKVLFNHGFDPSIGDKPLGKPATMREDRTGLYVEVPLDDTSYNRDLVASLRSGALDGQSFRFSVKREDWQEADGKDRPLPVRTLKEVRLFEFGPVTFPAYQATTAGVRARDAYIAYRQARPSDAGDPATSDDAASSPDDAADSGTSQAIPEPRSIKAEALALARAKALAASETRP